MKALELKEMIKNLPDDADIFFANEDQDYKRGLTPLYHAKQRIRNHPDYPWYKWENTIAEKDIDLPLIQVVVEGTEPVWYVLSD